MTDLPVTDVKAALKPPRNQWLDVWDQFRTHKGAMIGMVLMILTVAFVAVVIMTLVAGLVQAITGYGETGGDPATMEQPGILIIVLQLALSWLYVMFGICILTTLYGVIVERREI